MPASYLKVAVAGACLALAPQALSARDRGSAEPARNPDSFERLSSLVGEWSADEQQSLRVVFEPTAAGSVIVERWMVGDRTHSLTLYHRDGSRVLATHYCPQGNQPRLEARGDERNAVAFSFANATDLDPGESYAHDLRFTWQDDGVVTRSETYHGPEGAGEPSTLTLRPAG